MASKGGPPSGGNYPPNAQPNQAVKPSSGQSEKPVVLMPAARQNYKGSGQQPQCSQIAQACSPPGAADSSNNIVKAAQLFSPPVVGGQQQLHSQSAQNYCSPAVGMIQPQQGQPVQGYMQPSQNIQQYHVFQGATQPNMVNFSGPPFNQVSGGGSQQQQSADAASVQTGQT